jgi:hypothetical protein
MDQSIPGTVGHSWVGAHKPRFHRAIFLSQIHGKNIAEAFWCHER